MATEAERSKASAEYGEEGVDSLPFNTPEKSDRYRTERFHGAIGLNWIDADPTLQRALRYYLSDDDFAWAEPRLRALGDVVAGAGTRRAGSPSSPGSRPSN